MRCHPSFTLQKVLKIAVIRIFSILTVLIFFPSLVSAEILTYTHVVRQPFSGSQSPDDARTAAIAKAKREVLEKAGTYLDSIKIVKDHQLVQNQILALSSALLKAEVVSQKNYVSGESFGVEIEAKVCVDTATMEDRIKKFLEDRSSLEKAERLEQREKELLAKISELEQQNRLNDERRGPGKKKTKQKDLNKRLSETVTRLTALEAHRKALELWTGRKFADPMRALELLNQAIRKDDHFADAYNNRGIVKGELGKWAEALSDCNEALRLDPERAESYLNRGTAYANLGKSELAIEDFQQAIQRNSNNPLAYYDRGTAFARIGKYQEALQDFDKAAELSPNMASIYYNKGNTYIEMGEHLKAIRSYDEAIRHDPKIASFYFNRAVCYAVLGHFDRSLSDLDQAILLDPKDVTAYLNRGLALFKIEEYRKAISDFDHVLHFQQDERQAYKYRGLSYLMLGDDKQFCTDLQTACRIGECADLEKARSEGQCK